jgi:hypothetical protein
MFRLLLLRWYEYYLYSANLRERRFILSTELNVITFFMFHIQKVSLQVLV